jgi:hypothetical protein
MTAMIQFFVIQEDPVGTIYPGTSVMLACMLVFGIIIVTCLVYAYRAKKDRALCKEDFKTYMGMAVFAACMLAWVVWTMWSHLGSAVGPA